MKATLIRLPNTPPPPKTFAEYIERCMHNVTVEIHEKDGAFLASAMREGYQVCCGSRQRTVRNALIDLHEIFQHKYEGVPELLGNFEIEEKQS